MAFNPSSPVTGASQTGLTSPTYTLTADVAPNNNGKQYAVTALGGTQTGVEAHAAAFPFTLTFVRPSSFKPAPTTANGSVPKNVYTVIARKGVYCGPSNTIPSIALGRVTLEIPAGADVYDPESVRAMESALIGLLSGNSAGIGDTTINGVM